jgi:IS5 family transposase
MKRSVAVDAEGIPLGVITAPANRHDSPLLSDTLHTALELPEQASVHLDSAYDSKITREILQSRDLIGVISEKGEPAPLKAGMRWIVERTNSRHSAHKKLLWCIEREERVIDFWVAFSNVAILVRWLIRKAWSQYRWETRLSRRP